MNKWDGDNICSTVSLLTAVISWHLGAWVFFALAMFEYFAHGFRAYKTIKREREK